MFAHHISLLKFKSLFIISRHFIKVWYTILKHCKIVCLTVFFNFFTKYTFDFRTFPVWMIGKHIMITHGMVFCYWNRSDLLWEKIVLVVEKNFGIQDWRPIICKIFEITRTIYSNSERPEQFLVKECFFDLLLEVSRSNNLE